MSGCTGLVSRPACNSIALALERGTNRRLCVMKSVQLRLRDLTTDSNGYIKVIFRHLFMLLSDPKVFGCFFVLDEFLIHNDFSHLLVFLKSGSHQMFRAHTPTIFGREKGYGKC